VKDGDRNPSDNIDYAILYGEAGEDPEDPEEPKNPCAGGHSWNSGTITKNATCTKTGVKTFTCTVCGKTKTSNLKALGHTWKHYKKAAGLLKNGTEYDYCTRCKIRKNVKTLKGHAALYVKSYKLSAGSRSFTAKWKKQSASVQKKFNGYQLRYSLKSNMSGAKYVKVSKKAGYKKISKLKKKKRYYVQVRTYTVKSGKTFYSKWSARKSIKTK